MMKEMINSKVYWKSVAIAGGMFIIVFSLLMFFMNHRGDFNEFYTVKLSEGKWIRYIISRIVGGFVYGLFMGYVGYRNKKLKERKS